MGPGATVGVLGRWIPRLACLRPAAWLKRRPSTAQLHQLKLKTLARGQASRGGRREASSGASSPGRLVRRRRDQGRAPRKEPVTQAMTIETRQAPGGCRPAQCPCFPFGAKGASAGAEYRGIKQRFPYRCNETKTSRTARRRSPCSPRRRHLQSLLHAKTAFVRISCTSCPLSNWPLLAPFPLNIWGEDQGLYK